MQAPWKEYEQAIDDCYPELSNARISITKLKVQEVEHHFSEVIKILQKFVSPIGPQTER